MEIFEHGFSHVKGGVSLNGGNTGRRGAEPATCSVFARIVGGAITCLSYEYLGRIDWQIFRQLISDVELQERSRREF